MIEFCFVKFMLCNSSLLVNFALGPIISRFKCSWTLKWLGPRLGLGVGNGAVWRNGGWWLVTCLCQLTLRKCFLFLHVSFPLIKAYELIFPSNLVKTVSTFHGCVSSAPSEVPAHFHANLTFNRQI